MQLCRHDELSVSALAEPFEISLPAILRHLAVLEHAGLIRRTKSGRTVHCRVVRGRMREAMAWLTEQEQFWQGRLKDLAAFAEAGDAREE